MLVLQFKIYNLQLFNLQLRKFAHEFFRVDDKAVVDGRADRGGFIPCLNRESDAATIDFIDGSFAGYFLTYSGSFRLPTFLPGI